MGPVEKALRNYFSASDGKDLQAVAECFAPSVTYVRQPPPDGSGTGDLAVIQGLPDLRKFLEQRGPIDSRHEIHEVLETGNTGFVEAEGGVRLDDTLYRFLFMARARVDDSGLITHYTTVSALSTPGILAKVHATRG